MRKLAVLLACVLAFLASPAWADPPTSIPALNVPPGYEVTAMRPLGPGVLQATLVRRDPAEVVNLAIRGPRSPAELRVVLSNDAIGGPAPRLERTSAMCARIDCLAAVNGDFFEMQTGLPVGAVVSDDQLLRSPNAKHHQLSEAAGGDLSTGQLAWRGTLVPSDLDQVTLDGVNVPRDSGKLVLYTPAEGPSTGTNPFGAELVLQIVRPAGPILLGNTTLVRLVALRHGGDTPIPADGAVLSGHNKGQRVLEDLWARVQSGRANPEALLRLDVTPDAIQSVGGSPILVRNGRRWFAEENRDLYTLRAPRTLAGWTPEGDLLLATVDGRQPGYSVGMTMDEASDLMIGLGAVEAINLDGGGSTSFVVDGSVVNRPSDRAVRRGGVTRIVKTLAPGDRVIGNVERPVAVAVALVGPRTLAPFGGTAAPGSLVIPFGGMGAAANRPAILPTGAEGPDTSVLLMVLIALAVAVYCARRKRAMLAPAPAPEAL